MERSHFITYIVIIYVMPCFAYVTRLTCKRHANFTIMKPDIRYAGTVQETHADVIARDCALLCLSRDACAYFNHKMDNTSCELLAINSGTEQSAYGWKFYSTNYGTANRGPVCRSLAPCPYTSACVDICESPGYECIAHQFQGMYGTGHISPGSVSDSYDISKLTDGDLTTFAATLSRVDAFMSLDLGREQLVRFVTVMIYSSSNNYEISIGNANSKTGNTLCSLLPPYANVQILVECANHLSGRYVVLYHTTTAHVIHCTDMKAYVDV